MNVRLRNFLAGGFIDITLTTQCLWCRQKGSIFRQTFCYTGYENSHAEATPPGLLKLEISENVISAILSLRPSSVNCVQGSIKRDNSIVVSLFTAAYAA